MIQNKFLSLCAIVFSIIVSATASAAPLEKTSLQIQRTNKSQLLMTDSLSQNFFTSSNECSRYETVQIPYNETEYYTVNVPYNEQVAYYDTVTEYRTERQCRPNSSTNQVCHIEQECTLVPGSGSGQVCEKVRECGTNAQGQQICKVREVCRDGQDNGPQQQCRDKRVCQNVLVPGEICENVQVPYTRQVTRYRNETRYRQETRSRTVTKYRQEQRCVGTSNQPQFDHQALFVVKIQFPATATLSSTQKEILRLSLISRSESNPQVRLESINTIYNYRIRQQSVSGNVITIKLEIVGSAPNTGGGNTIPPNPGNTGNHGSNLSQTNLASLKDAANINGSVIGSGIKSALVITDLTKEFSDVSTEYAIYLDLVVAGGKSKPLNTKSYKRQQIKSLNMTVLLSDVIGYAQVSQTALKAGNKIFCSIIAKRSGTSSLLTNSVKAQKTIQFTIK